MKVKKYWVIVAIVLLVFFAILYLVKTYNPESTTLFPQCLIYKYTGLKCAGCGMTRAVHYLLNFNFKKAFLFNPLIFVFIIYFIYFLLKCVVYILRRKEITKNSFNTSLYILAGITIIYMIVRNFINI